MMRIFIVGLILFSINSYALFCPNSFSVIKMGDTVADVQKTCGAPASERTFSSAPSSNVVEWEFIKPSRDDQSTARVQFLLNNNKVVNIHIVNDNQANTQICHAIQLGADITHVEVSCKNASQDVTSTNLCGGVVRVGDSGQLIEFVCGKPLSIRQLPGDPGVQVQLTEYSYEGATPATLVFENGRLKEKR